MKASTNLKGIKVNYIKTKTGHSVVLKLFVQSTKINDKKEEGKLGSRSIEDKLAFRS